MLNQVFVLCILILPHSLGTHWGVKIPNMQEKKKPAFYFVLLVGSKALCFRSKPLDQKGDSGWGESEG